MSQRSLYEVVGFAEDASVPEDLQILPEDLPWSSLGPCTTLAKACAESLAWFLSSTGPNAVTTHKLKGTAVVESRTGRVLSLLLAGDLEPCLVQPARGAKRRAKPSKDVNTLWSSNCAGEIFIASSEPGSKEGQLRIGHFQGDAKTAEYVCELHNTRNARR